MYEPIVGDDVRHRKHPVPSWLGEDVCARTGQRSARPDEGFVYPVHPLDDPAGPGQVQLGRRGTGQDAGSGAAGHQLAHRGRVQLHIGVEVHTRKGGAGAVAQPERVRLPRYRCLYDPYAVHLFRSHCGAVRAGVRDHDDVELAGRAAVQQPAEVGRDDRFLVVRRYDDADHGLAHAGKNSRYPGWRRP
jgi:hypothetical protein